MNYFAQLDKDSVVINVIVLSNSQLIDEAGYLNEDKGAKYCETFGEGPWIPCHPRAPRRSASIGAVYRKELGAFQGPQPYPSWRFSDETWSWEPPVPMPVSTGPWYWAEDTLTWEKDSE